MRKFKFITGAIVVAFALLVIFWVLSSDKALLTHPKGTIAHGELHLMATNVPLMLAIVIPTLILLLVTLWKSLGKPKAEHDSEQSYGAVAQVFLWLAPAIIVAIMAVVTWHATYKLDPFRPLETQPPIKPITIQVVALDWKWLFIYPEQEIATVNFVQFPARAPIHFELSADNSPMNSFWIPQLSGQIYSMTGMVTSLHIMADEPGEYIGRAAEINGDGFADMTFVVKSCSQSDFDDWVTQVKQSPLTLTESVYHELAAPSSKNPIVLYSYVDKNLFSHIVMEPLRPNPES